MNSSTCHGISLCPSIPSAWTATNYTLASCAVPVCGNNTDILQSCCGGANTTIGYFTNDGIYGSCTANTTSVQVFQDCLLRSSAYSFMCSAPGDDTSTTTCKDISTGVMSDIPGKDTANGTLCSVPTTVNGTALLRKCCGSEPLSYAEGCYEYCRSSRAKADLEDCISEGYSQVDRPVYCSTRKERLTSDAAHGSEASRSGSAIALFLFFVWLFVVTAL